jgi:2,4-dienoyl-CoA reductase-like NADH-dependent reductase (Old Yellow Enzyme family)
MQLNHPGRQAMKGLNVETVGPSAVPFAPHMQRFFATPRALEETEIHDIVARFGRTAAIAEQAGFDGVQIHAAHGYLISQFLSPHTNQRDDAWGGDAVRRRAFTQAVYQSIRAATGPGFGVGIKINSADFQKGGISEEESAETIRALAAEGMDFVEISGGTYEAPAMAGLKASTQRREAYFLTFAEAVRAHLTVPLLVTGGFRSGQAMADAVDAGTVDLVGMARPLAVEPDFPQRLVSEGDVRVELAPRRTGIKAIDRLGMLEVTWYERQLHRMAKGKAPRPNESGLRSFFGYLWSHGIIRTLRTRRAR